MSAFRSTPRPPRGFEWSLAPLLRKTEWALDAARLHLAQQQAAADAAAADADQLDRSRRDQLASLARIMQITPEPRAHQAAMDYLAQLATRLATANQRSEAAAAQARSARQECVSCQQRLDALLSMRDRAIDTQLREQARRDAKEADLSWLVRHGARVADAQEARLP